MSDDRDADRPGDRTIDRRAVRPGRGAARPSGVYTIIDARGLNVGFGDPVGPRVFPYVIGTGMVVLAVLLAVATARGDVAEAEEGEDVDLTTPPDWLTVGKLVGILVLNLAAGERAGLGDHRRAALRRLRVGAGQPHPAA